MAHFYTLVTEDSREREFAVKRQLFLTEQGYRYRIVNGLDGLAPANGGNGACSPAEQSANEPGQGLVLQHSKSGE